MNLSKNEIVRLLADEQNEPALLKMGGSDQKKICRRCHTPARFD